MQIMLEHNDALLFYKYSVANVLPSSLELDNGPANAI